MYVKRFITSAHLKTAYITMYNGLMKFMMFTYTCIARASSTSHVIFDAETDMVHDGIGTKLGCVR